MIKQMSKKTNNSFVSFDAIVEWQPTNREKVLKSKQGKFWCNSCDAQLIHEGQKCPNCNKHDVSKKLKKYYIDI